MDGYTMSLYAWQKQIKLNCSNKKNIKKIMFKTQSAQWVETESPIIIPFSIHSKFHDGEMGEHKVRSLITTIKEHTKAPITILLTEEAHVQVLSLSYESDIQKASAECFIDAKTLANQFKHFFEGCDVQFWCTMISNDPEYQHYKTKIRHIYETDTQFQQLLYSDAQSTYSAEREQQFPNKEEFIQKSIEDLLEQAIYLFIMSKRGFRFEFYPGKPFSSSEYINRTFLPAETQLLRITVCLTTQK